MSRWSVAAYVAGAVFFVVSCSVAFFYGYKVHTHQLPVEKKSQEKYKYHFVMVPEELDNEYWRLVEKGAKSAAKQYGVLLEYVGPKQANIDDHLKMIQMFAASKVDGIMTQGLSDQEFTPLINKVVESGIPVITVDTDASNASNCKRFAYIGTDNYYSGYLAGKALIADTNGKANVAILTGSFNKNHQQQRVKGFEDAVKQEPGIRIVDVEESNISRVRAAEKAYQILQSHPEVNAFFGTSALDGIGIAQVVEKYKSNGDIYIMAFDTLPETISYIRKGTIKATVVQEPFQMGYGAVKMMIDIMEGRDVPSVVHTDTWIMREKDLVKSQQGRMEGRP